MQLRKRRFKRDDDGNWSCGEEIGVCGHELGKLFNIPESTRTIWISLHTRPARHRETALVVADGYGYPCLNVGDDKVWYSYFSLDKLLGRHLGKTLYVEVEYE